MDSEQEKMYGDTVAKWKAAAKSYGTGWDEDGKEIPVDFPIEVDMVNYFLRGLYQVHDGVRNHVFAHPQCDVMARVLKVKAHMNRMISSMEFSQDELRHGDPLASVMSVHDRESPQHVFEVAPTDDSINPVDIWDFVRLAVEKLRDAHHGSGYRVMARGKLMTKLSGHCTGIPSSLPWDAAFGYHLRRDGDKPDGAELPGVYLFELSTTAFTVCPFVLHETDGHQSHTQRTHIQIKLWTTAPVRFAPIMREVTGRLVPVMSNMKIPDEIVQVLKSYSGPTFTEDGAVRVQKMLRGITGEFVPEGEVINCEVRVVSEDSHLAHDIVTTLEDDLA